MEYKKIKNLLSSRAGRNIPNAIAYEHDPQVAPMYYKYIFYNALSKSDLDDFVFSCPYVVASSLRTFYSHFNGLRIGQSFSIYGSLLNRGFQPISLDYGNLHERPLGLASGSTVIGSLIEGEKSYSYLIVDSKGSVSQTSTVFQCDTVRQWASIEDLIVEQIDA